jgi:hypothetical protein
MTSLTSRISGPEVPQKRVLLNDSFCEGKQEEARELGSERAEPNDHYKYKKCEECEKKLK